MADPAPLERLQPCLLDRLIDDRPGEQVESRSDRLITPKKYQQGVLRDLYWLFNTSSHLPDEEIYEYPEAARSVLNYGVRNLCGLDAQSLDMNELERRFVEAISIFEPRILPKTLQMKAVPHQHRPNLIVLEIRGQLWAKPIPEPLFIKTEIDLETGKFVFGDRAHE